MTKYIATEFTITLGAHDMSEFATSVEISSEVSAEDSTTFRSEGWNDKTAGMKSASASLEMLTDFDAAGLDEILWDMFGTVQTLKVRPKAGAVSTSNPSYEVDVIVASHSVGAGVGDLATAGPSLEATGKVRRVTTP